MHEVRKYEIYRQLCFLPFPLRKLSSAFGLTAKISWYPHYFNTEENLHYVGSIPNVTYYGVDDMSFGEKTDFREWYESHLSVLFDNRRVMEAYCQDDVTVLREACQVFRHECLQVGNIQILKKPLQSRPRAIKYCANIFINGLHSFDSYWWLFGQRQIQPESADMAGIQRKAGRVMNNARLKRSRVQTASTASIECGWLL